MAVSRPPVTRPVREGAARTVVPARLPIGKSARKSRIQISKRLSNEAGKSIPMQDLESSRITAPILSRGFKEFIRIAGMTHVKTSTYYPQSNRKIERYHVTPYTMLAGKEKEPFALRDEKLEANRERRRLRRAEAIQNVE